MPSHFDADFRPDGYLNKWIGLWILPVIMFLLWLAGRKSISFKIGILIMVGFLIHISLVFYAIFLAGCSISRLRFVANLTVFPY
ncbi:DUF1648 domain-containing protein [Weizmannia acidilactici]|nr:DUF1648 domain-containing protein [Weizmannia acidilactici]